ncbi:MAG: isoprenylcysteine carboxylmethyltransferase family protein [Bacteroidales bacterium]
MSKVELIILIMLTIVNAWLSWIVSLKDKRYHGIFRFVSFESILILVLLNNHVWFNNALAWYQLISWLLLGSSLLIAFFGFYLFYHHGKPADGMEETTALITSGLYKYIRHPLYLSLILGGFGVMMKDLNRLSLILALVNLLALYLTARVEEKEMIKRFGQDYVEYMNGTKMFIPFML